MGLAEISKCVHLHKSTAHRIMAVLERHGFIERNAADGTYRLGWKLCELGTRAVAGLDLPTLARPLLQELVDATGETAHVGVLRNGEVISLVNVESRRQIRSPATVGRRNPAHCTSHGKAILAFAGREELKAYFSIARLLPYTQNTITDRRGFLAELKRVREAGYAVDDEEYEDGLRCVGAPIRDHSGSVIAALSIAGPTSRLTAELMPRVSRQVVAAAARLSASLGFREAGPGLQRAGA